MTKLWDLDPWLKPYAQRLEERRARSHHRLEEIRHTAGSLRDFANGHLYYGLHPLQREGSRREEGHIYREWAPKADALYLIGDFNHWDRRRHPLRRISDETWEIVLPRHSGLTHGQRYKVHILTGDGSHDRIPLYARRVIQDPHTLDFAAQVWEPPQSFVWRHPTGPHGERPPLLIYEAHVGMAQEMSGIGSYRDFATEILPRVADGGYTALQLMAIMEHPYYGSFGYHVSNFFAPSSRFGTPEDLKFLIDEAHRLGLRVLLDVVHSHAAKNEREGLPRFDGTMSQFFHEGPRGLHPLWDSMVFDYKRPGVQHFLLSSLKYWTEEFRFDGFRFDGVTSMLFMHHGVGVTFDHYDRYFGDAVDEDGVTYLTLANQLVHEINPHAVTIAEDVSGMPGVAAKVEDGGLGFDYRLSMGLPDFWIKSVTERRDEDWSMGEIFRTMTDARPGEPVVGYVESHDQALVGDKTIIFRMADAGMYGSMHQKTPHVGVERAVALHKLFRLITLGLGSDAYLNFMGNEFGHPEWVDFPREGNGWSCQYARRQWSLRDHPELRYRCLADFDRALMTLAREFRLFEQAKPRPILLDEHRKILAWHRGPLVFAVNLHPVQSQTALDLWVPDQKTSSWRVLLDADDRTFGGYSRLQETVIIGEGDHLTFDLPCRTGVVLHPKID